MDEVDVLHDTASIDSSRHEERIKRQKCVRNIQKCCIRSKLLCT